MPKVEDFIADFGAEEEGGGGGVRVKESWYRFKILSAKPVTASTGNTGLELTLTFAEGKYKSQKKKLKETLYTSPKAIKRLRLLLEALDITPPKGKANLAKIAKDIKGGEFYGEVEDDERDGYPTRSRITFEGFQSVDEFEPDEDDEDLEDEDLEDEDLEDEEDEEEDEEEEPAPKRSRKPAAKKAAPKRRAKPVEDDDDEDEDDDEEDEEEEAPPKRRRTAAKKPAAKKTSSRRKKATEDEDDLEDLDLDDL